jgi:hypothetical protein
MQALSSDPTSLSELRGQTQWDLSWIREVDKVFLISELAAKRQERIGDQTQQ